ncbi:hypothetical protein LTS18_011459, partial [Coniosporium uncinatum]
LSSARSDLEVRKSTIEVELRENLRLRLDQLNSQDVDSNGTGTSTTASARLKERQRELKRIDQAVQAVQTKLRESETSIEQATTQLTELSQQRTARQQQQEEIAKEIEAHQRKMERSMAKKARLNESAAETARNIRDLGVLPEQAFDKKYDPSRLDSATAMQRLHKIKDALKKFSHVNKKAFEQYENFTKQQETLTKRRSELDSSQRSIEELIEVLDQRKDEAIERTFKQVSREFANVFEKLVPAGKGRLVIQRKSDKQARQQDVETEEEEGDGVENYTGVGISVSFNSKHDEQQRIQQLSGGQKSLCALALVFAIQRCDPAPFYLFDEIDANLDAQYRTAVAAMLQQLSEGGQFICTTFRPEMVLVAEKCYGVSYSNKTSSIDVVEREAALEFVEGQRQ